MAITSEDSGIKSFAHSRSIDSVVVVSNSFVGLKLLVVATLKTQNFMDFTNFVISLRINLKEACYRKLDYRLVQEDAHSCYLKQAIPN